MSHEQIEAPWAKLPLSLIRDPEMTRGDVMVYGLLDYRAGKRGWFWGAQIDFATELGIGLRSVNRSVQKLEVAGYITTRAGGMRKHNRRVYYILARTIAVPTRLEVYATDGVVTTPLMAQTITQTPDTDTTSDDEERSSSWETWWARISTGHPFPTRSSLINPSSYFKQAGPPPVRFNSHQWDLFVGSVEVGRQTRLPQRSPGISLGPLIIPVPGLVKALLPMADRFWDTDRGINRILAGIQAVKPRMPDWSDALETIAKNPSDFMEAVERWKPDTTPLEERGTTFG